MCCGRTYRGIEAEIYVTLKHLQFGHYRCLRDTDFRVLHVGSSNTLAAVIRGMLASYSIIWTLKAQVANRKSKRV